MRPFHLIGGGHDPTLLSVLLVGGVASGLLLGLAGLAFARRRSWSYLLVTLALSTLLVRTGFGVLTMERLFDPAAHHLVEHGLDVLAVALLLGAVALARAVDAGGEPSP